MLLAIIADSSIYYRAILFIHHSKVFQRVLSLPTSTSYTNGQLLQQEWLTGFLVISQNYEMRIVEITIQIKIKLYVTTCLICSKINKKFLREVKFDC